MEGRTPASLQRLPNANDVYSLIAVVDHVARSPLADGHLERVQHQLGPEMVRHRPADDLAAPGIEHDCKVEEPRGGRDEGDVSDPEPVRARGGEPAVDQVRGWSGLLVPPRRDWPVAATAGADETGFAHEPRNPLAPVSLSSSPQLGVHTGRPICLA
jgi:hypothetical protein